MGYFDTGKCEKCGEVIRHPPRHEDSAALCLECEATATRKLVIRRYGGPLFNTGWFELGWRNDGLPDLWWGMCVNEDELRRAIQELKRQERNLEIVNEDTDA